MGERDGAIVSFPKQFITNSSTFISINRVLSPWTSLHCPMHQGCPLAPYLYVLTTNALGYLLEASHIAGWIHGILLLHGSKMVSNHFVDDPFPLIIKGSR